ncbi:MAG: molybdopterin synthase sulfur carrier subunit [Psychromonas sp.]|jgi:molybdopterin synthase sulfur carrier subunit|uniref:molybdopterin converting factor subunit 1 n=1 Tax=Psychromonas sp. TaxID=1884585 RepID=UPI0039E620E8
MIKVLFFAQIRDQLGVSELEVPSAENNDLTTLLSNLKLRDNNYLSVLSKSTLMVAVNQTMCSHNTALSSGDEVAFFPPVTGG